MLKLIAVVLCILVGMAAAELPSKKYLNLAAIKTMVAAAEAEAQKLHVEVTICIAEALKKGNVDVLAFPDFFPNQGGLPIQIDGQTVGAIAASGAKSEIDEAIAQAAIDALLKK